MLNRSPASLVLEIILVDDASDSDWLGDKLTTYIEDNLPDKVGGLVLPSGGSGC